MFVYVVSVSSSFSGVGFSFIFVWILMGIVTTLFVVGGNVEKLVCEPLANRQLYKVKNTSSLPSWIILYSLLSFLWLFLGESFIWAGYWYKTNNTEALCQWLSVCVCVCADHRHTIPSSSRQEELPSWDAVSESKHWLDFGKHVQVMYRFADFFLNFPKFFTIPFLMFGMKTSTFYRLNHAVSVSQGLLWEQRSVPCSAARDHVQHQLIPQQNCGKYQFPV